MKNVLKQALLVLIAVSLLALSSAGCGKKSDAAGGSDSSSGIFPRLGI